MLIEINAFYPGAQGCQLSTGGQNYYRITMDGAEAYMSGWMLERLFEPVQAQSIEVPVKVVKKKKKNK